MALREDQLHSASGGADTTREEGSTKVERDDGGTGVCDLCCWIFQVG